MSTRFNRVGVVMLAALVVFGGAERALAQGRGRVVSHAHPHFRVYHPGYAYPANPRHHGLVWYGAVPSYYGSAWYGFSPFYYNPWGYGGDPYGGYLSGAANVISAQGEYLINTQQAYRIKEQTRSAQMDNRRKAFDEYLYEKANTPTLNDTRIREQQEELRRALTNPPQTEIWSGYTLNNLLANAQHMQARGIHGPNIPLGADLLRHINVSVKDVGNVGLLKAVDKPRWPYAIRALEPRSAVGELRGRVDALLLEGKRQAVTGEVDAGILTELNGTIDQLRTMLRDEVQNIEFNDYIVAKRFLRELDGAVRLLKLPDVDKYLNSQYTARGQNVKELVAYRSANGLKFSAAVAGEESAYSALYQALLQYTVGSHVLVARRTPVSPGGTSHLPR